MTFLGGKGKSLTAQPQSRAVAPTFRPKLDGEKASFVMPCSTNPPKATEYLLLIVNGTQFVGGKRTAKLVGGSGKGEAVQVGGLVFKNGLDRSCTICGNATFGGCTNCGTFSCFTEGKAMACPKCGHYSPNPQFGKKTAPINGAKPAPGRRGADQALTASGRRLITDQRK